MPTTTTPTALEALDQIDRLAIRVGRRMEEVREQLLLVGQRGRPGNLQIGQNPVAPTGRIGEVLREISIAQRLAAREGEAADTSKLEAQLKDLERQSEDLGRELGAVGREHQQCGYDRANAIREYHAGFVENARAVAAEGDELRATAAAAANDLAAHRIKAQQAINLALAGHPGASPGAPQAAEQDRKQLFRSFAPWVGGAPADNALWDAVAKVSSVPGGVA